LRYFLDAEFNGSVHPTELISIGIVSDVGKTFYAISDTYNPDTCSTWVKNNVLKTEILHHFGKEDPCSHEQIRKDLYAFLGDDQFIQFWTWFGAMEDWNLFNKILGVDFATRPGWSNMCYDVRQFMYHGKVKFSDLPQKRQPEHNSLSDALWTKDAFQAVCEKTEVFPGKVRK